MGGGSGHLRVTHLSIHQRGAVCTTRRVGTCARGQSKGVGCGCDSPCLALIGIAHMWGLVAALTPATAPDTLLFVVLRVCLQAPLPACGWCSHVWPTAAGAPHDKHSPGSQSPAHVIALPGTCSCHAQVRVPKPAARIHPAGRSADVALLQHSACLCLLQADIFLHELWTLW
jgi:hypothetical protein